MRSESKTLKHSLKHWGIWLFILIALNFCVIFWVVADGLSVLFDRSKIEETQEGSGDETDTSTESEFVRYPEGAIKIDSYEQKMTYFRNWCLYFLFIPEQLGDQCTVSVKLPELNGENGGWLEYLGSVGKKDWLPAFYFGKGDELYYSDYQMLTWEEVLFKDQKTLYLDNVRSNSGSFSIRKTDEITDEFENNYLIISGDLKQEIYEPNTIALKYWKWGGLMEVVGFWHMEQTGQCFGTLRGDIYVTDYSDKECWVCIDGLEAVKFKLPSTNLTLRLTESPIPIEGVKFNREEKEQVKACLSFDLKVETLNDEETEESPATEGETEATEFTEWIPVIRYPEGSIMIDSDEQKMMYFRNWYLSYLNVPGRLGDSCYISVKIPQLEGKYGK